ncbi:MAG TPA: aminoacyl-tRNA hydrolase [Vicinamibacterales bacterium]|jgi:peptidyl-tRNA hydrolase, PTH1 family|nr:aminoacyl-tRNA hydrolase [Vicinamibacterales bacterium]
MKLIVGLGNPGRKYAGTRHNVGFEIIDTLAERHRLEWTSAPVEALLAKWRAEDVLFAKPLTFMNLSGHAVGELLRYFKIDLPDLLVVVDDINLELGRLRGRPAGSAGGHNGLKSLIGQLGTDQFARLRVGVGRGDARRDLGDHVLARFEPDERPVVAEAVGRAADAAETFVSDGIAVVMNRYNRKEDGD